MKKSIQTNIYHACIWQIIDVLILFILLGNNKLFYKKENEFTLKNKNKEFSDIKIVFSGSPINQNF